MRKNLIMITILIMLMSFVGCGSKDAKKDESKADSKVVKKKQEVKKEKPKAETENKITFSSTDISGEGFNLTYLEGVKHNMQTGEKKYIAIIIQLANYDRGGGSYHPNAKEDGQIRVTVSFSAPSEQELKVGKYTLDAKMGEGQFLSVGIEGKVNGHAKTIGLYNGEGFGEITHIDTKTISGTVDLKDSKGTIIKATFTTSYSKSIY